MRKGEVLHLSELTKLSNSIVVANVCAGVLHLSELTKLSNDAGSDGWHKLFYIFLN